MAREVGTQRNKEDWDRTNNQPISQRWGSKTPIDRGEFKLLQDLIKLDPLGISLSELRDLVKIDLENEAEFHLVAQLAYSLILDDLIIESSQTEVSKDPKDRHQDFKAAPQVNRSKFQRLLKMIPSNFEEISVHSLLSVLGQSISVPAREQVIKIAYRIVLDDREKETAGDSATSKDLEIEGRTLPKIPSGISEQILPKLELSLFQVRIKTIGPFEGKSDLVRKLKERYPIYRAKKHSLLNASITQLLPRLLSDAYRKNSHISEAPKSSGERISDPKKKDESEIISPEELERLRSENSRLRSENSKLKDREKISAGVLKKLEDSKEDLLKQLRELRSELVKVREVSDHNRVLKEKSTAQENRIKSQKDKISELEVERKELKALLATLSELESHVTKLKGTISNLSKEKKEVIEDKNKLSESIDTLKIRNTKLENRFARENWEKEEEAREVFSQKIIPLLQGLLGEKGEFKAVITGKWNRAKRIAVLDQILTNIGEMVSILEKPIDKPEPKQVPKAKRKRKKRR